MRPERILITCLTLSLLTNCKFAQSPQPTRSLENIVDAIIKPYSDSMLIAGIAVGIMESDSLLFSKAYGHADLEFDIPLSIGCSFQIGSITKQFTAVAIMQLAEKGLLNIDQTIDTYMAFEHEKHAPTIRQLLTHTSGIKGHGAVPAFRSLLMESSDRDTIVRLVEKEPFDFAPGSAMLYSNTGYILLGLIIEKVAHTSYQEYIIDNIITKAGMSNTYFCDRTAIKKDRAHGYNFVDGGKYRAEEPYYHWTFSAGGLCSTVEDLLKWQKVLHQDETLLTRSSYNELIDPGQLDDGTQLRYAKGFQSYTKHDIPIIAHGGSGSGILAEIRYYPHQKISMVTLENSYRREHWFDIGDEISKLLLPPSKGKEIYPGKLSDFEGTYEGNWKVEIESTPSDLLVKRNPTIRDTLKYNGDDKWYLGDDEYYFTQGVDGEQFLHIDMIYAHFKFRKSNQ